MYITKGAGLLASGRPDAQQLEAIHAFTRSPLTAEEVYCFSVRLCDDQPDRDNERFDTAALSRLAELFYGKTGIIDHEWSAEHQVARIFATDVVHAGGVNFIRAQCYMLRTEKNEALIADIEGGIRSEVSVGCAMEHMRCSICGSDYGICEHRKGVTYDGKLCVAVLTDPVDAYEFSFVAVPAQRQAGVLKAGKGGRSMTLQEMVRKSGSGELERALRELEQAAAFGMQCRDRLLEESVSLGLLLDFGAEEEVLRKAFSALDGAQLQALHQGMKEKAAALFPPQPQLHPCGGQFTAVEAEYMI